MCGQKEFVYVLECKASEDCPGVSPGTPVYYVGYSKDNSSGPVTRIYQHFMAQGSKWTQLNKRRKVVSVQLGDKLIETSVYAQNCALYGWQRVRGSSWCQDHMNKPAFVEKVEKYLEKDLVSASSSGKGHTPVFTRGILSMELMDDHTMSQCRSLRRHEDPAVAQAEMLDQLRDCADAYCPCEVVPDGSRLQSEYVVACRVEPPRRLS